MKKKSKRVKFKVKNILIFLIIIMVLGLLVWLFLNRKIKNIYVTGNKLLREQEILELSGIESYPKYLQISNSKITKRLKGNQLIKSANVKKGLSSITIEIEEYEALFYTEYDSSVMLSNMEKLYVTEKYLGIPILINQVDSGYQAIFVKKMSLIDKSILAKISEISYEPNEFDKERFLLYMNDKNYVYLTLTKFDYINKYDELLPKLEGKKGILYLDSGNHFEIKNNN